VYILNFDTQILCIFFLRYDLKILNWGSQYLNGEPSLHMKNPSYGFEDLVYFGLL
jgi:hypothetical protein